MSTSRPAMTSSPCALAMSSILVSPSPSLSASAAFVHVVPPPVDLLSKRPAWMTLSSMSSLYRARANMASSTLFSVMKRKMRTTFVCPIRWARS